MKKPLRIATAIILTLFGLLTLFLSSSVIFDLFGIRSKQGYYVLFVVWVNFICSILYLIAAYGLLKLRKWTPKVLLVSAILLALTFFAFLGFVNDGGTYETKTIGALIFRTAVTLAFTGTAHYILKKRLPVRK